MEEKKFTGTGRASRRDFLKTTGALTAGLAFGAQTAGFAQAPAEKLAMNGGPAAVTAPYGDATKWPQYGKDEEDAMMAMLRSPSYDSVKQLEAEWSAFLGVPYSKAHCNGTSALASMFFALDLPPGSEIMVPSYTFFATIMPMRLFGLVPVFVDINPRTLNFDLEDAKKRLTPNTKAVLPVHWIGLPADMDLIGDWAKEKGLIVLEDAAHSQGSKLKDRHMGTWGRMSITSYQMSKALPGIEGGMGMYQDKQDFERATSLGNYDMPGIDQNGNYWKYKGSGLGLKFRMHPMSAALIHCQLKGLVERNERGAKQVRAMNDRLTQLPGLYEQTSGRKDVQRMHYAWNMLFIDEKEAGMTREAAVKALKAEGVKADAHYYTLQHELPVYKEAGWWHHPPAIPDLPASTKANTTGISLPFFTNEVPELAEQYVKAFEKVWAHRSELT